MTVSPQLSALAAFAIIVSVALILSVFGMILYALSRSPRPKAHMSSTYSVAEHRPVSQIGHKRYSRFSLESLQKYLGSSGGNGLYGSESFTSIRISPSKPVIFGDEKNTDKVLRVMITPPTPSKGGRKIALVDDDF